MREALLKKSLLVVNDVNSLSPNSATCLTRYLMENDALISKCGSYRYWLTRRCGNLFADKGLALFVMLNPSTADAQNNDPTIRRCINFADIWGFKNMAVANLYAYRATKPKDLWKAEDPIGPRNDYWLKSLTRHCSQIICAWGVNAQSQRIVDFKALMASSESRMWCLGTTKNGSPRHPLYVKANTPLIEWEG